MTVKEISFGAHVDYAQNSKFIQEIGAQHVVLVHGEASQMGRLRAALRDTYAARGQEINIHTPKNCEPLTLTFQAERTVKVGLTFLLGRGVLTNRRSGRWRRNGRNTGRRSKVCSFRKTFRTPFSIQRT